MEEISATTLEHLDLLLNHLGSESKSQGENIRASNPRDPDKAVREIWDRLDREYGSAETIELALKKRINAFPTLTDGDRKRYFDLSDLAAEVESIKCDSVIGSTFAYFDTSSGINEFVRKLPKRLREKWATECDRYKVRNNVLQAPFSLFTKFLRDLARLRNDPSFIFDSSPLHSSCGGPQPSHPRSKAVQCNAGRSANLLIKKTDVETKSDSDSTIVRCPIHGTNSKHALKDCHKFGTRSLKERKDYIYKNGYCLRCCGEKRHLRKNCKKTVKCDVCGSTDHLSILHPETDSGKDNEGEQNQVNSHCTEVCGTMKTTSKSCAKIVLAVVYPIDQQCRARKVYCMIDDQSNKSLATSAFFNSFGERGPETEYVLSSCAGKFATSGRKASNYVVESLDGSCTLRLPCLIECNDLPNNRGEIPSPPVARSYTHLNNIEQFIPVVDESVGIELLIGRDLVAAHHVLDQRVGGDGLPYGQKLRLGWVIIGEVCLGKAHQPEVISVSKTSVLIDGRPTHLLPCENEFLVKEESVFQRTPGDERPGLRIKNSWT